MGLVDGNKKFIEKLLAALDDPKVQGRIRELSGGRPMPETMEEEECFAKGRRAEDVSRLAEENDLLKQKLAASGKREILFQEQLAQVRREQEELRQKLAETRETADELQTEMNNREREYAMEGRKASEKMGELTDELAQAKAVARPFERLLSYFSLAKRLPTVLQENLRKYIRLDDPLTFAVTCADIENLCNLWDVGKRMVDTLQEDERQALGALIAFGLHLVNTNYQAPVFALIDGTEGQEFDDEWHQRSRRCSAYQGTIVRQLLPGIRNCNSGKALRKAIVEY